MVETLVKELRYAVRMLLNSPGFTVVAMLSLALGIGVNTTIFSVVSAFLLRPMPVHRPDQLVDVYTNDSDGYPYSVSSYPDYRDFRDQNDVFSGLIAHNFTFSIYDRDNQSELVFGEVVSGNYFDVLGIEAAIGRTFLPEEDSAPGIHPVAVLGYRFWQRRFGGDLGAVGETIKLNGHAFTLVGVMPESFTGTIPVYSPDLWTPFAMETVVGLGGPDPERLEKRGSRSIFIKGRLKHGVELGQAEAQMNTIMARLGQEYPETNEDRTVAILHSEEVRIHPIVDKAATPIAGSLMVIVGLVLLISCANVANMLLARGSATPTGDRYPSRDWSGADASCTPTTHRKHHSRDGRRRSGLTLDLLGYRPCFRDSTASADITGDRPGHRYQGVSICAIFVPRHGYSVWLGAGSSSHETGSHFFAKG